MASRGGNKTSGVRRPTGKARAPARRGARKEPAFTISLRPEHQRELFALGLITVALVTLVFFLTGVAGGVGGVYLDLVRRAFGSGALVVPLTLGLLGVAILIQERMQDAKLSGANAVGTLLVLAAILGLLEFPFHSVNPADRIDQGGGLLGFWFVEGLDRSIGRPAAVLVVIVLGLAGVMLTFNITLRELIIGISMRLVRFWALLWSAPRRQAAPRRAPATDADLPFHPPPLGAADDDLVETPIAARPTKASLFQRPGGEPVVPVGKAAVVETPRRGVSTTAALPTGTTCSPPGR